MGYTTWTAPNLDDTENRSMWHYLLDEPDRDGRGQVTLYRTKHDYNVPKLAGKLEHGHPVPAQIIVFTFQKNYCLDGKKYDSQLDSMCKEHGVMGQGTVSVRRKPELNYRYQDSDSIVIYLEDYPRECERDLVTLHKVEPCCPHCNDNRTANIYRGTAEDTSELDRYYWVPRGYRGDFDINIKGNEVTLRIPFSE